MAVGQTGGHRKMVADWYADNNALVKLYKASPFIAIGAIARKIACQEAVAKRRIVKKSGIHKELLKPSHPLCELLCEPNEQDTPYDVHFLTTGWRLTCGQAYIEQLPNAFGIPVRLWPLSPQWVRPVPSQQRFIECYRINTQYIGTREYDIPAREMVVIRENALDKSHNRRFYGYAPMLAAQSSIELEQIMHNRLRHRFDNYAEPGLILSTEQKLSEHTLRQVHHQIWSQHRYQEETGKPMVLHSGFRLEAGGDKSKDKEMDYRGSLQDIRTAILANYGVPAAVVGLVADVNRSNAEAALYSFAHNRVNPDLIQYGQAFTKHLARRFEQDLIIEFQPFNPFDVQDMIKAVEMCIKGGALTPNEIRDVLLNFQPLRKGGDTPVLQAGMESASYGNNPGTGLEVATGDERSGV